ncbi:hypothetical protein [[Ruminococcus] torques]|uniref:hypothetical protein n=1 Tax=[Ruminococcus] torques TaxID=33039 RepID=UPI0025A3D6A6|nr:hypothetical protein [[Ruminococcus] torques]MDM8235919.1 hypothetical protein [[Ruminococcus] torques]
MYIKIYTKSQLVLLRSVNGLFRKKYRLPQEILNRVEAILMVKDLGEHGFVAVLLDPVENDMTGIEDVLNCYPYILKDDEDVENVSVDESDTWLTKGKEWYMDTLKIKGEKSWIYVLYSMTVQRIYK